MAFSISKLIPQKLSIQSVLMTGVISWVVMFKDKTKSNPHTNQKVRSITKSVVSFKSFPVSLRGVFAAKGQIMVELMFLQVLMLIE